MAKKLSFFQLIFPKANHQFPSTPEIEIHARHDGLYERMTPKITESEVDQYIDQMIDELESIRKEAKKKFAAAKSNYKS